jgi:hypothetical protein
MVFIALMVVEVLYIQLIKVVGLTNASRWSVTRWLAARVVSLGGGRIRPACRTFGAGQDDQE